MRIETADGEPRAICDGTTLWRFESGSDVPVEAAANAMRLIGTAERLLLRRAAHEFAGDDFTRPTGPIGTTTFLGRPAWTVEFAPPLRKPYPLQQVVDQETGIVLQQRSDQAGLVIDEWLSIAVGEPIDDGLFTWAGPVVTTAEQQRSRDAEHERRRQELRDWFARNVTDSPLTVRVPLDLAVDYVHTHDDATGAFEASIGTGLLSGSLARRARSAEPWDLSWIESAYRWSTDEHDWAVYLHHRAELDRAALTELQARLGATPQ